MSKIEIVENEIRIFHKSWLAEYVAKAIEIYNRVYIDEDIGNYQQIYNSCLDEFIYSDEERKEIYDFVDDILTRKYGLLIANNAFDGKHIYLVDLRKED